MSCLTDKLLAEGAVPQNFTKDDETFYPGHPELAYRRRTGEDRLSVHWGQRKLILAVVQFFIYFWDTISQIETPKVVYAGAAPGTNINLLVKMFPNFEWHLYDPRAVWKIKPSERVNIYTQYFTDETAEEWANRDDVLFLSDIRIVTDEFTQMLGSDMMYSQEEYSRITRGQEERIMSDMRMQEQWYRIIKPVLASLKFRLPYLMSVGKIKQNVPAGSQLIPVDQDTFNQYRIGAVFAVKVKNGDQSAIYQGGTVVEKDPMTNIITISSGFEFDLPSGMDVIAPNQELGTRYLSGVVAKGIWAPQSSTEGRLTPLPYTGEGGLQYDEIIWDNLSYESMQFWQNVHNRQKVVYNNLFTGNPTPYEGSELCNDFDSTAEAYILIFYLNLVLGIEAVSPVDVAIMSNLITVYINNGPLSSVSEPIQTDIERYVDNFDISAWDEQHPKWVTLAKLRKDTRLISKLRGKTKRTKQPPANYSVPSLGEPTSNVPQMPDVARFVPSEVLGLSITGVGPATPIDAGDPVPVLSGQTIESPGSTTIAIRDVSGLVTLPEYTTIGNVTTVPAPPANYNPGPNEYVSNETYAIEIAPPAGLSDVILV